MKSPFANWTPKTPQGIDNARLLKAHAKKKRAKAKPKADQPKRLAIKSARHKPGGFLVQLMTRSCLPTDESWEFMSGSSIPMPGGSNDASEEDRQLALRRAAPDNRILKFRTSTTLRGALGLIVDALERPLPLWIEPDSCWLCIWLPGCGRISEARELLRLNPSIAHFPKLILPATWVVAGPEGLKGEKYRGWRDALNSGEPAEHWGCYALIYLDNPAQRVPLYQATLARLYLRGFGVFELKRGFILQSPIRLVLHCNLEDQPLHRVPRKTGKTHRSFWMERTALDLPERDIPSARAPSQLELSPAEKRQYNEMIQRMAAPIEPEEADRYDCNHDFHFE